MGKHFQLSTTSLKETSSQIALTCALFAYHAQYGDIKFDPNATKADRVTETLRIKTYLQAIISAVVDEQSRKQLDWFYLDHSEYQATQSEQDLPIEVQDDESQDDESNETQALISNSTNALDSSAGTDSHQNVSTRFSFISRLFCKLNQFSKDNELQHLNRAAILELKAFFNNFEIANAQHAKELNEYNGDKACPVSNRRIAAVAGVSVFAGSNIAYLVTDFDEMGYVVDNDFYFGEQDNELTAECMGNSALAMVLGAAISYLIFANYKRDDKQSRGTQVVAQICRTTTLGLTRVSRNELKPTASNFDTPTLPSLTLTEQEKTLKTLNRNFNIESIKANISAQGSKWRQRVTIGCKLVVATLLYTLDFTTLGLSLKARILIAVAVGTVSGISRYYAKLEYNKKKLWCRKWRQDTDLAFLNRYTSELTVFGLQPADAAVPVSPDLADEKRQVEIDVECFIQSCADSGTIPLYRPKHESQSDYLNKLKQFAQNNLAGEYQKYLGYHKYFVAEFLFQMRVKYLKQNTAEVNAERQALFSSHLTALVGREDSKSISRNHKYKTIALYKKNQKNSEMQKAETHPGQADAVRELVTSPEDVYIATTQETHRRMLQQCDWLNSAKQYFSNSLNVVSSNPDEVKVKQRLRHTIGFHAYKRKRLGVMPWEKVSENAEQLAVDAYYQKKYMQAERDIATEKTERKRVYNFKNFFDREKNIYDRSIEVKVCGDSYKITQREIFREIYSHFPPSVTCFSSFKSNRLSAELIKKHLQYTRGFVNFCHKNPKEKSVHDLLNQYYQEQYKESIKAIIIRKAGKTTEYFKSSDRLFLELLRDEKLKEKHQINMAGTLESSIISGIKNTVLSFMPFMPELYFCAQQVGNAVANFATKCVIGTTVSTFFVYKAAQTNREIKNNLRSTISDRERQLVP